MFEMLFGYPLFTKKSAHETALRIVHLNKPLRFLHKAVVSAHTIDLINHLLCDKQCRYGFEQLKNHPFFLGFDFENPNEIQPPLIPLLAVPTDVSNFDEITDATPTTTTEVADSELARCAFLGFS